MNNLASTSKGPRLVKSKLQEKLFVIPSFITVVASFCGFLAVVSAVRGNFEYAAKAIGVAMLLDGLDGRVARRLNATSEFGKEFDSLSDVIAFGVAPAILIYHWAFVPVADEFGLLISFLFMVCGAIRLARFNVRAGKESKSSFEGLPIPGAAFAIVSLVYFHPVALQSVVWAAAVMFYAAFLSMMMISTLPFYSPKKFRLADTNLRLALAVMAGAVALTWYHSHLVFMLVANGYAMSGLTMWAIGKNRARATTHFS